MIITEKINIALIDDHQMLSNSLATLLANYDFIDSIKTFGTGDEFLHSIKKELPDVVITDIVVYALKLLQNLYIREEFKEQYGDEFSVKYCPLLAKTHVVKIIFSSLMF